MASALERFGTRRRAPQMREIMKARQKQRQEQQEARRKERAKQQFEMQRAAAQALGGSLFSAVAEGSAQQIYQTVQNATKARFSQVDAARRKV